MKLFNWFKKQDTNDSTDRINYLESVNLKYRSELADVNRLHKLCALELKDLKVILRKLSEENVPVKNEPEQKA